MHAKKLDKIATAVLYSIAGIIVAILASLILYILVRGLPHISWSFLTGKSSALALTVFNLPQMTRNVEDSLKHVHHTQREAGLALGISRLETVVHVVIPEALPGIVTGVVLASGRIFGEAAALIYTAGQSAPALDWSNWNILSVTSPISIFRQAETLAVHIWKVNSEGTIPDGTIVSAGSAAVLLIFILIFNFGARKLGSYLHKKLTAA
ncbi:binding-protein-dependent transport system inner membrane component family protein [Streptococcus mitis]|uniref:Phosphate ABC transporter permease n=1 Tax=Streptococcus mitis TaxID=28037 RepID=A0A081Q5T8_STRMT|nr:ABC transporter permease subunit [Streptococcus mitis]KEQ38311.1 binding-protein-dependent transport system inner membrane component family protein [Streptococcus mitis]KJQ72808.1 phosphate ABC transporter permease [Streptococcus mitis]